MITQEEYEEAQELVWDYEDQLKEQGKAFDTSEETALNIDLVSKRNAKGYAEFCVICDRGKLPLLELDDYIKHYGC